MPPSKRQAASGDAFRGSQKRAKVIIVSDRVTRSASRNSTMAAVFLTTELLENILKYLPMRDLLLAQRVSRKWKDVITKSTTLQQMLFLAPTKAEFCWLYDDKLHLPFRKWPKIVDCDYIVPDTPPQGIRSQSLLQNGQINPLVFEISSLTAVDDGTEYGGGTLLELRKCFGTPALKHPEASWRKMYISQPPIKEGKFWGFREPSFQQGVADEFEWTMTGETHLKCGEFVETGGRVEECDVIEILPNLVAYPSERELPMMLAEQDFMVS